MSSMMTNVYVGKAAPTAEFMSDNHGFYLYQTNSECCYFCAPPNLDWGVYQHTGTNSELSLDQIRSRPQMASALEQSSFCDRCFPICGQAGRRTRFEVFGEKVLRDSQQHPSPQFIIEKGRSCHYSSCCFRPYLNVKDAQTGSHIGSSRWKFHCSTVPHYQIEQGGVDLYDLSPDSCCCGCCIDCGKVECKCRGTRCCVLPYYLRSMDGEKQEGALLQKLWPGFASQICTRQSLYEVRYPPNISSDNTLKPLLLSAALLMDMIESAQEDDAGANRHHPS